MATDYSTFEEAEKKPRRWLGPLLLILLAFAGGAFAMGYALTHWGTASAYLAGKPAATPGVRPAQLASASPNESARLVAEGAIDQRVADLEARLAKIDERATAAVGNADRAEGLLVAFAARRALDRGMTLGYIEPLLRERFGAGQPQAVATIIASARQPTTIEDLESQLADLGPVLQGEGPDVSWWDSFRRELAGLIVVRRVDTPSPDPADRLIRARRQLEAGHVGAALAEVNRMPGRDKAGPWMARANRYAAAREALDVIETAALIGPRQAVTPDITPPAR